MKILIDARLYGLENAGLGRYLINLISSLQKLDEKNKYVIILRKRYFNELNLSNNFKKILFDKGHYSFSEQFLFPAIIKKENPDLIHYPHFNISIFCNKPFVVTIHDLLMHKQKGKEATTLPMPVYILKRFFYKFIFNVAIQKSIKIIAPSDYVKKEIVNYYNVSEEKISVCNEGVSFYEQGNIDSDNFLKKNKIESPYLLYVGNAYPHKNLKRAIEAISSLQKDRQINFVIVSARNVFFERLNKFVQSNSYGNFVKILSFIPDKDLMTLYNKSEGFLYPSISEGFGLQGLEAMIQKTPCVVSDIEAFREIYKDNAIYFNPTDINSIKSAIEKLLIMDKTKKEEIVTKAYKFAKNYSWDKMAKQILKIYEDSFSLR
ncbi:MAG: glycosyltransferase family 1 protein [Patescibacteria group bacterium]